MGATGHHASDWCVDEFDAWLVGRALAATDATGLSL
jgi:hypothetical protein